jgi:hypothetical protein
MRKKAFLWYDPEGNVLEVHFGNDPGEGEMVETNDPDVQARVNDKGEIIGFHLIGLRSFDGMKAGVVELDLTPAQPLTQEGDHRPTLLERVLGMIPPSRR